MLRVYFHHFSFPFLCRVTPQDSITTLQRPSSTAPILLSSPSRHFFYNFIIVFISAFRSSSPTPSLSIYLLILFFSYHSPRKTSYQPKFCSKFIAYLNPSLRYLNNMINSYKQHARYCIYIKRSKNEDKKHKKTEFQYHNQKVYHKKTGKRKIYQK